MPRAGGPVGVFEDVIDKTDYDVIDGTSNTVRVADAACGALRTVADAAQVKGGPIRWADDGRA